MMLLNPYRFATGGGGGGSFQWVRLYVTANDGGSYVSFSELQVFTSSDGTGTNLCSGRGSFASQTGDGAVDPAAKGCDGDIGTECGSTWSGGPYSWMTDLGASYAPASMKLSSQRAVTGRTPTTFVLQGAPSSSGPWTDLVTVASSTGWGLQETRTFS